MKCPARASRLREEAVDSSPCESYPSGSTAGTCCSIRRVPAAGTRALRGLGAGQSVVLQAAISLQHQSTAGRCRAAAGWITAGEGAAATSVVLNSSLRPLPAQHWHRLVTVAAVTVRRVHRDPVWCRASRGLCGLPDGAGRARPCIILSTACVQVVRRVSGGPSQHEQRRAATWAVSRSAHARQQSSPLSLGQPGGAW
jgi:hypothetical protein